MVLFVVSEMDREIVIRVAEREASVSVVSSYTSPIKHSCAGDTRCPF